MSGQGFPLSARAVRLSWRLLVVLSLCLCVPRARSQETRKGAGKEDVVTVSSNLVNIDVTVKDKKGNFVNNLKAEDFEVFENGVQQKVEFFDPPFGGGTGAARPVASKPSDARDPQWEAKNVISLVLDGQTTEQQNLKPLREGTLKYIRERIAETDAVALFNVTTGLQLLQPFTRDKA
ncbi:MAG: VWA domain-containing protein, partial [Acidobacteriota bacterium]|nr:VWA domain-containing protein [Acidobacteriota bacterium]